MAAELHKTERKYRREDRYAIVGDPPGEEVLDPGGQPIQEGLVNVVLQRGREAEPWTIRSVTVHGRNYRMADFPSLQALARAPQWVQDLAAQSLGLAEAERLAAAIQLAEEHHRKGA